MNNAFRAAFSFCFLLCLTPTLLAQNTQQVATDSLTAEPNVFDGINGFYMHPLSGYHSGNLLQANFDLQYSSNAAVNNLAYNFYLQKNISASSVNKTVSKLSAINIGGRESNTGIKYQWASKKESHFFSVKYNFRNHQSVRFSDEFGKFFFKGNKQFANDTMDANDLRYLSIRYDALMGGWKHSFSLNGKKAAIEIHAGIARGFSYRNILVTKGSLFTEQNGDFIDIRLSMEAQRSQYLPYNPVKAAGFGAIADVDFSLRITEKSGIGISISDIGFITWDNKSAAYNRGDTVIRFNGVFIPSLDSLGNQEYSRRIGDSIITTFNIPYTNGGFSKMLPTRFSLTYYMAFTKKNYLNIRLQAMAFTSYRTQLSVESVNFINPRLYSITGVSLGGFGPFDVYQRIGWQINKKWHASLGLFGVEGMLLPSLTAGFGGNAGISLRL